MCRVTWFTQPAVAIYFWTYDVCKAWFRRWNAGEIGAVTLPHPMPADVHLGLGFDSIHLGLSVDFAAQEKLQHDHQLVAAAAAVAGHGSNFRRSELSVPQLMVRVV